MAPEANTTEISADFVIVGGGLSGLVVASRLSEDANATVLVIEAGSDRRGDPKIDTPGLMTTLYDDPAYDWLHMTTPQTNANNRQIAWPRGKVLGGTSAMNFSALVYPAKSDFDNWYVFFFLPFIEELNTSFEQHIRYRTGNLVLKMHCTVFTLQYPTSLFLKSDLLTEEQGQL